MTSGDDLREWARGGNFLSLLTTSERFPERIFSLRWWGKKFPSLAHSPRSFPEVIPWGHSLTELAQGMVRCADPMTNYCLCHCNENYILSENIMIPCRESPIQIIINLSDMIYSSAQGIWDSDPQNVLMNWVEADALPFSKKKLPLT